MNKKIIFSLIFILLIASFFRLWKLDLVPPALYPDVAINGNDALQALKTKDFKVFYHENNGREGLFINLIAFSFLIFGVSVWSIKIVAALIGIATILGMYLFAKEIFDYSKIKNSEFIALISSFFLTTSFWHVNFSRLGFRAIFTPLILVFSFYFLFKGLRTKKLKDLAIAGLIFGLGFHTYISFRLAIFLLMTVLLVWLLIYKKNRELKKYFSLVFCFFLFILIAALPIGIYFLQNSGDFISRATGVSVFSQSQPISAFIKSMVIHLIMFNFKGDGNWRHNIAGSPVLFWPIGILFLIGLLISVKDFFLSLKNKNYSLLLLHSTLLGWFLVMLLPSALTYEGIPHSLRSIGAIPPVFIFAAMGMEFFYRKIKEKITKFPKRTSWEKGLFIGLILLFSFFTYAEYQRYFVDWGKNIEVKGAFTQNYFELGNYLNSLPEEKEKNKETKKYVIVNEPGVPVPFPDGLPMPAQTVMFIENTKIYKRRKIQSIYLPSKATYLSSDELNKIEINENYKLTVIALMKYDDGLFEKINQLFPGGEVYKKDGFGVYLIRTYLR